MLKSAAVAIWTGMVIMLSGCAEKQAVNTTDPYLLISAIKPDSTDRMLIGRFIKHAMAETEKITAESIKIRMEEAPEMFAWLDFKYMNLLLDAYELTRYTGHLDLFKRKMDLFLSVMTEGPDGYKGWYGPYIKSRRFDPEKPDEKVDEIQMNFQAMAVFARWCRLAAADPVAGKKYMEHIAGIKRIMARDIFEKMDARQRYVDLGPDKGGLYRMSTKTGKMKSRGMTLPFEKLSIMFHGLIQMHLCTGDDRYLKRAVKIGTRLKRSLAIKDNRYTWNYWQPATRDDADMEKDTWVHWINPEPQGGWYDVTTSIAVTLYRMGLVFDQTDLQRFLKTQMVCWNGDLENPDYRVVSGDTIPTRFVKKSAFLSHGLALFDRQLTELAWGPGAQERAAAQKDNGWASGIGLREYVAGKFIDIPMILFGDKVLSEAGKAFRNNKDNQVFLQPLTFTVKEPGCVTPAAPSIMFGR